MKAVIDGTTISLGKEGRALYEQSGYGRPVKDGLRLFPQEALYLLHRNRIEIAGETFDSLFAALAQDPGFLRSFLVYRDLRERGYVVQAGPHDFRVFRRGAKPGTGESLYLVRVLSERDPVVFSTLINEVTAAQHMRKQYLLAVVDDEDELTYYEVKLPRPGEPACTPAATPLPRDAVLVGRSAIIAVPAGSELEHAGFGKRLDDARLLLSPVEILWLMGQGAVTLQDAHGTISRDRFLALAGEADRELLAKLAVYTGLRAAGFIPRTGYKFGHHFRVYCSGESHSDLLVHAIGKDEELQMSLISRSVRMAHSVKKKMFFGTVHSSGIQFVEFARIKL